MPLMTPQDAARFLSISTKHLRNLTNAGEIRYVDIGNGTERGRLRYSLEDLQAFIDARARREEPASTAAGRRGTKGSYIALIDFQSRRDARAKPKRSA